MGRHRWRSTPAQLQRCAVKYGLAINYTVELAGMIAAACELAGIDFEIEMSVDETERPTTLAEHYIIASRLLDCGVNLVSLAPRYIGGFEKGIDYLGDPVVFEANVAAHAAIAQKPWTIQVEPAFRFGQAVDLPGIRPRPPKGDFTSRRRGRATWKPCEW